MLPIKLHLELEAKKAQEEEAAKRAQETAKALAEQGGVSLHAPIPAGKAQFMTMIPCALVHPGVIVHEQINQGIKEILDSIDVAEIAAPHILEGATIVPLLPEINRETKELTFAISVTVQLGDVSQEALARMNPAQLAKTIMDGMEKINPPEMQTQVLYPTMSLTPPSSVDPFEQ
jgi:hypothetical protein